MKVCDTLVSHNFWYQKLSETPKGYSRIFLANIKFSTSFCYTPSMIHNTSMQSQKLPETIETCKKIRRAPLLQFRYCDTGRQKDFRHFLVTPSHGLLRLLGRTG